MNNKECKNCKYGWGNREFYYIGKCINCDDIKRNNYVALIEENNEEEKENDSKSL